MVVRTKAGYADICLYIILMITRQTQQGSDHLSVTSKNPTGKCELPDVDSDKECISRFEMRMFERSNSAGPDFAGNGHCHLDAGDRENRCTCVHSRGLS